MKQPLISCIMPTKDRRVFVEQSLRYFEMQDYPNKELIIVDDGEDLVVDLASQRPNVRYLAPQYAHTVGVKRNIAIEAAHGEIICHWDDDDWYAPSRLSYQVQPFITGDADITGLHLNYVLDLKHMQGWKCGDLPETRAGVDGLHYGTALYRKQLWENWSRFRDNPKGDDGAGFVRRLINRGAKAYTMPCAGHQVYVRHGKNVWKYHPGDSIGDEKWQQISIRDCIPAEDLPFYETALQRMPKKVTVSPVTKIKNHVHKLITRHIVPLAASAAKR